MSGRPLDVLEAAVGNEVEVRLKSGETYRGTLAGYDQHMNLVLDDVEASPEDATGVASADDAGSESGEESDDDRSENADDLAENNRDTTIIRGDNVVSITP